jgi:pyruvate kinase
VFFHVLKEIRPKEPVLSDNIAILKECIVVILQVVLDVFVTEGPLPDWLKDVDVRVQFGLKFGKGRGFIKVGDPVVVVTGWKQGSGFTNTIRIMYVSSVIKGAMNGGIGQFNLFEFAEKQSNIPFHTQLSFEINYLLV